MGICKRAFISVLQRKVNSLILFVIVFLLANVVLTTLSVNTAIKSTKDRVLSQITPTISIDYNPNIFEDGDSEIPPLNSKMATKLYNQTKDIVKSFDYSQSAGLYVRNEFKEPVLLSEEQSKKVESAMTKTLSGSYAISVLGTQVSLKAKDAGEGKLLSGKGFTKEDIEKGAFKVLITKQLAQANDLSIGSHMVLSSEVYGDEAIESLKSGVETVEPSYSKDYEFEIIGILEMTKLEDFIKKAKTQDITKVKDEYFEISYLASQVYVPNETLHKINQDSEIGMAELSDGNEIESIIEDVVSPQYVLADRNDLETFKKRALEVYPSEMYRITSTSDMYNIAGKPMESMRTLLDGIFMFTVIACVVMLSLVLCIFMYLRQKEMGILLALGERKVNIVGQLLIETLIIALLGVTLAIVTANIFSTMLADYTLQSLMSVSDSSINNSISTLGSGAPTIRADMISQQYRGGFNVATIIIFYGTMIATIIIAQFITALYVLRLSPKKILM